MKCTQRLYLTKDRKKVVEEGHKHAATLYAVPGDEIPQSAVDKFGLVDGHLKGFNPEKEDRGGRDKEQKGGKDKGDGKTDSPTDDLTKIKGIGPGVANALAAVGIVSFAGLAEIDPESAPEIDKLPPAFDWSAVVEAAKAQAETSGGEA